MNKRKMMLMQLLTRIIALAAACSGNYTSGSSNSSNQTGNQPAEQSGSGGKQVTLTFGIWDSNQEPGLRIMADEFKAANPGIKINIEVTAWGDSWSMLYDGATCGSLTDVLWMHSKQIYRYASNDM